MIPTRPPPSCRAPTGSCLNPAAAGYIPIGAEPVLPPPPAPKVVNRRAVRYPFGDSTTLLIRNIPNCLSQRKLMELLAEHCAEMNKEAGEVISEFDLLFLPVDYYLIDTPGYAFVNFTSAIGAARFYDDWNQLEWDALGYGNSCYNRCAITVAKLQGERLKERWKRCEFDVPKDEYLPVELVPACNGFNTSAVATPTLGKRFIRSERSRDSFMGWEGLDEYFQRYELDFATEDNLPVELVPVCNTRVEGSRCFDFLLQLLWC